MVRGTRLRLGSQHAPRIHAPSPVLPFTTVYPAYLRKVLMGTATGGFFRYRGVQRMMRPKLRQARLVHGGIRAIRALGVHSNRRASDLSKLFRTTSSLLRLAAALTRIRIILHDVITLPWDVHPEAFFTRCALCVVPRVYFPRLVMISRIRRQATQCRRRRV